MGWDGTNKNQPRFINISYNLVHELGIFEKQSSFIFKQKVVRIILVIISHIMDQELVLI